VSIGEFNCVPSTYVGVWIRGNNGWGRGDYPQYNVRDEGVSHNTMLWARRFARIQR
jgi:hypothetical protein